MSEVILNTFAESWISKFEHTLFIWHSGYRSKSFTRTSGRDLNNLRKQDEIIECHLDLLGLIFLLTELSLANYVWNFYNTHQKVKFEKRNILSLN